MNAQRRPLVLVRGFGGPNVKDEQTSSYQGFNDGSVYPGRRGENYIYEGFVLRAIKSDRYPHRDATNVVGYYAEDVPPPPDPMGFAPDVLSGSVVLDPSVARRVLADGVTGTMWVYRYYDLKPRAIRRYGEGLARLIDIIRKGAEVRGEPFDGVDVVAHSMGGLVVRAALADMAGHGRDPHQLVHRIVTLGTPHRGIAFQLLPRWLVESLPIVKESGDELAAFDPRGTDFLNIERWFDPRRILTVVGTDHRSYGNKLAAVANRLAGLFDEGTLAYNRSDGLVKQAAAQLPGAPRTFVHKCHGGHDSLVSSREAYEIAMRFFHGTHRVRLWLDRANISRGGDFFSRSEFFLGVSIKARYVDFELFHQSPEAENCYGPFHERDLSDELPDLHRTLRRPLAETGDETLGWAGPDRLVWEGWVDARTSAATSGDLVFRLDLYVGERDSFGIGFSDNVVIRKQYYVQAVVEPGPLELFVHTGEQFLGPRAADGLAEIARRAADPDSVEVDRAEPAETPGQWRFRTVGTGFEATWRVAIEPEPTG
jgi:pimeloyl-ACP methyl ester carboxylesterase